MTKLVPVAQAQARMLATVPTLDPETIPVTQALGRWAIAPILAARTQPGSDLSAMDGYAIRHADLPGAWRLIGESAAGRPFDGMVGARETVRIFTGAAMPAGADTVMVQEEATRDGDAVRLDGEGPARVGGNVRRRGLDFAAGDTLIEAGERLTPARLAVAATGGVRDVAVRRHVRVAIAATGDELIEPGAPVTGHELPESNRLLIRSLLADLPVEIVDLGILRDDRGAMRDAFAAVDADLLVTTGGASVGDHDLVRPALEDAGGRIDFWRIALRPGKPMMAGMLGRTIVLGLPGNPVSAFVTAILFVRPVIAALSGARDPLPATMTLATGEPLPANGARTDYLRARLIDGRAFVSAIQDSSMLLTLARSSVLVIRPADAPALPTGAMVEAIPIT